MKGWSVIIAVGSKGAMTGARQAAKVTKSKKQLPARASLCRIKKQFPVIGT
jgi:hypothetical protein